MNTISLYYPQPTMWLRSHTATGCRKENTFGLVCVRECVVSRMCLDACVLCSVYTAFWSELAREKENHRPFLIPPSIEGLHLCTHSVLLEGRGLGHAFTHLLFISFPSISLLHLHRSHASFAICTSGCITTFSAWILQSVQMFTSGNFVAAGFVYVIGVHAGTTCACLGQSPVI